MELNTPSRRGVIIKALHGVGTKWKRTVRGYPIELFREDDGRIGYVVVVRRPTRSTSAKFINGYETTVFDALARIEILIEAEVMSHGT
jgi:hypothetical protein